MKKTLKIFCFVSLLLFMAGFIYLEFCIFIPFSIGRFLVGTGIFLMFGTPIIYFFMNLVASLCGSKVIGQLITFQSFGGNDKSGGYQASYVFTDKNNKMHFITTHTGITRGKQNTPNKTILIKYIGPFHSIELIDNKTEQELNEYRWANIKMKEANLIYKKHNKKFGIIAVVGFFACCFLIVIGAIFI